MSSGGQKADLSIRSDTARKETEHTIGSVVVNYYVVNLELVLKWSIRLFPLL